MSITMHTLLGSTLITAASFATDFEYHHFETNIQLSVDSTMIAIYDETGPLDAPAFTTGILDAVAPSTVQGWSYVKTPQSAQSISGITQLIDQLTDSEQYDFVSPIFTGEGGLPYIPTQDLLVKRTVAADATEVTSLLEDIGVILDTNFSGMDRVYRVRTSLHDGREVLTLANELARMDIFEFAESDAIAWVKPMHIPNDPEFNQQWGLNQSNNHDMDLPEAWDITMGSGDIVVVVLDSGIDQSHPDIHQLTGQTFTGSSSNGNPGNACDNHGTAVSGCVAATIDNNQGVAGVAPHCWVRAGKIFNELEFFGFCLGFLEFQESWAVNGITWAADS
ncbi:MAG: S8 family serine peptidase, partial [Planctomycetes bacterium]|nr:S8 family serine peptidase [Planctomycetota bacterium]